MDFSFFPRLSLISDFSSRERNCQDILLSLSEGSASVARSRGAGHYRRHSGWSLIELIVVIVVLLVLSAFVLSLYQEIRGRSQEADCISRLRHVGVAFLLYTSEYNGNVIRTNRGPNLEKGWTRVMVNEGYVDKIAPWTVLHCPTANYPPSIQNSMKAYNPNSPNLGAGDSWRWYTYGLNMCRIPGVAGFYWYYDQTYQRDLEFFEYPVSRIENFSNHVLLADSTYGPKNSFYPSQVMERDNVRGLALRHGSKRNRYANAFFFDGHVEQVTKEKAEFLATPAGNYGLHLPPSYIFTEE